MNDWWSQLFDFSDYGALIVLLQNSILAGAVLGIVGGLVGVFVMSALGMRTFSGVTVGVVGAAIGVHYSIALSACILFAGLVALFVSVTRGARATQ